MKNPPYGRTVPFR